MPLLHRFGMIWDFDFEARLFQARGAMLPARTGVIKRYSEWVTVAGQRTGTDMIDAYPAVPYAAMDGLVKHYLRPFDEPTGGCCRTLRAEGERQAPP
jgi:hypothetical protein